MDDISAAEKIGINEFFHCQNDDQLVIGLAKLIANNLILPRDIEDAIEIITIHSTNVYNILNRKAITKEILFKYLHDRKIPVCSNDNTKVILIEKIKRYWHEQHQQQQKQEHQQQQQHLDTNSNNNQSITNPSHNNVNNNNTNQYENKPIVEQIDSMPENFPINELSRTFSKWFFNKFNENQLNAEDFYVDVVCEIKLNNNNNGMMHEQQTERNQYVLEMLHQLKSQFNYYFNPNFCHNGVQGRMNEHGLVIVLSCGTLHNINLQYYCGNFECVFGLIRDPFSDNNWKIKYIKLYLQHKSAQNESPSSSSSQFDDQQLTQVPQLMDCETLKEFLLLPSTSQNI